MSRAKKPSGPRTVRCAVYCRKSTEEGLQLAFNSLDAQREACEAYIKSQASEGWVCLPDRYDDGGYSGGNMDRPAMTRLLADIEAGRVDCVVVYKFDRLSRSMRDFFKLMELLEAKGVSFVATSQQLNTAQATGRLMLNMLLSFAEFERELVSERTRDKIAAQRRKGKWWGGHPLLGYDIKVSETGSRLLVNAEEAAIVRQIFELYRERQSLMAVVGVLIQSGWTTKRWSTKAGRSRGGRQFDKNALYNLLTNQTYLGLVKHKNECFAGEHEAIVPERLFRAVQEGLAHNGRTGGAAVRNRYHALLKGLLHCECCHCGMAHAYSSKKGGNGVKGTKGSGAILYRYYVCHRAQKHGWSACPAPSVPAKAIETFVIERLADIGRDPRLVAETVRQAHREALASIKTLQTEQTTLQNEHKRLLGQVKLTANKGGAGLADISARITTIERRLSELKEPLEDLRCRLVSEQEVIAAFSRFDDLWSALEPHEQVRLMALLVKRVEWDGRAEQIRIMFQPAGLRGLVDRTNSQEAAA